MKYNLNLTKEYVSHWGLREALRELIANTIDEQGAIEFAQSTLILTTNKVLPMDAFLMGYSVKENQNAIGQFGEGLKLAMLVLTRLERPVYFRAGKLFYKFLFDIPEGFTIPTLHLFTQEISYTEAHDEELADLLEDESHLALEHPYDENNTVIMIPHLPKSMVDEIYIDQPLDSVLPNHRGLYCQGLLIEKNFYVKFKEVEYGVNLNASIKGNRDRNYFGDKRLIIPILERTFQPEDFLYFSTSWYENEIYIGLSRAMKEKVAMAWLVKTDPYYKERPVPEGTRILIPQDNNRYFKKAGYIVTNPWWYGGYLMSDEDKQLLDELRINNDFSDQNTADTARRNKANRIMKDLAATVDVYDFAKMLLSYITLVDYRNEVESYAYSVLKAHLAATSIPEPRLLEVNEDEGDEGEDE